MNKPSPEHHSNPETVMLEPVYIFTDKAIPSPPKRPPLPTAERGEEPKPEEPKPAAGQSAEDNK